MKRIISGQSHSNLLLSCNVAWRGNSDVISPSIFLNPDSLVASANVRMSFPPGRKVRLAVTRRTVQGSVSKNQGSPEGRAAPPPRAETKKPAWSNTLR